MDWCKQTKKALAVDINAGGPRRPPNLRLESLTASREERYTRRV
jgi:hypothetical protein